MRVLLVSEFYTPYYNGEVAVVRNLAHGLAKLGHDVHLATGSPTGKPYDERDGRVRVHRLKSVPVTPTQGKLGLRMTVFPRRRLEEVVRTVKPEVMHAHSPWPAGRSAERVARERHIPFMVTNHTLPENLINNLGPWRYLLPGITPVFWGWLMRFINRADYVTSPTETAIGYLRDHGLRIPRQAVSNGVDLRRFRPAAMRSKAGGSKATRSRAAAALAKQLQLPDKPTVLYMGRLDGEKRMDVWLEAARLVRRRVDAHFIIGGRGGELEKLRALAGELGIAEHVTFPGFIKEEALPELYRLSTVFAIASPAELQSLVTLEAMASGLPVVACDAGALPELCRDGKNGYLFPDGNASAMARRVIKILRYPKGGKRMGKESRRIVEQSHDLGDMPKRYVRIYKELQA